jgi:hypothetical protein
MGAKVRWLKDAWWVVTHHDGRRSVRRLGTTKADRKAAEEVAAKINGALALGTYAPAADRPFLCDAELRAWHEAYSPTMKASTVVLTSGHIENHLVPFFGETDLRDLTEEKLLAFIKTKLDDGLAAKPSSTRSPSCGGSTRFSFEGVTSPGTPRRISVNSCDGLGPPPRLRCPRRTPGRGKRC